MRFVALLLMSLSLMSCASWFRPQLAEVSLQNPGPLAARWMAPAQVIDGRTGQVVSEAQLLARLQQARVVYIGEMHTRAQDHAIQLHLIDALRKLDPSLGLGLEMLKRPFQAGIDGYLAGDLDEAQMLEQTEWPKRWGYDFALYRPIIEYARTHKLPIYALNARDELTRAVARNGIEQLSPELREQLVALNLGNEAHREVIREVFDAHGMAGGKMTFENFYTAQVIWDETMAHVVAQRLLAKGGPHRIVVLAGGGHIQRGHGIPSRAAALGAKPWVSIYPFVAHGDEDLVAEIVQEQVADFIWVMLPPESETGPSS